MAAEVAERMVLAAMQEQKVNSEVAGTTGVGSSCAAVSGLSAYAVVADTGATVKVIGKTDLP